MRCPNCQQPISIHPNIQSETYLYYRCEDQVYKVSEEGVELVWSDGRFAWNS
jgi:hypothetical protein